MLSLTRFTLMLRFWRCLISKINKQANKQISKISEEYGSISLSMLYIIFTSLYNRVKRASWLESHNDYTWLQLAYILGFGAELPSHVFNPNKQVLSLTSFSLYFTLTLCCTTDFIRSRVQTESLP